MGEKQFACKTPMVQLSETELREELSQSQDDINLNIPNQSCLTLAYPYGDENEYVQTVTSEYYIAGRGTWSPSSGYLIIILVVLILALISSVLQAIALMTGPLMKYKISLTWPRNPMLGFVVTPIMFIRNM